MSSPLPAPGVFTLGADPGLQIAVSDLGATWLGCHVPLADGSRRQVLLGHPQAADHATEPSYLGSTIGRFANRVAQACFRLDGQVHRLAPNEGPHQLHGGADGFHRRRWQVLDRDSLHLRLSLQSPDGDQGWPGALQAWVTYRVDPAEHAVTLLFEAVVDRACPVSITNHAYFNLDGHPSRDGDVRDHRLQVAAHRVLPVAPDMIPTGEMQPVHDTPFDLRRARRLGDGLGQGPQQQLAAGYDHCYVLDAAAARGERPAAELTAADGRLSMQLFTSYPSLQVYSGNHLAATRGRDGHLLRPHAGVALEPQFLPDSPNRPAWLAQGALLRPGQRLQRWMRLCFSAV